MARPRTQSETDQALSLLLYSALAEPIGLLVSLPECDFDRFRQRIYQLKVRDPALAGVQVRAWGASGEANCALVNTTISIPKRSPGAAGPAFGQETEKPE